MPIDRIIRNAVNEEMSGMLTNDSVIWLNHPSTLTNLAAATKTATAGMTSCAPFQRCGGGCAARALRQLNRRAWAAHRLPAHRGQAGRVCSIGLPADHAGAHGRHQPADHRRHLQPRSPRAVCLPQAARLSRATQASQVKTIAGGDTRTRSVCRPVGPTWHGCLGGMAGAAPPGQAYRHG